MNYSQATVCVLVSTKVDEDSFREHLACLEESGNNAEFFSDPDECIESLILTQHEKYLVILGSGRCHLVDILSSLPCILHIYLTEVHDFEDASHVRGIYSKPEQLLIKLKNDMKIIEDNELNFSISSSIEANMSGTTTKDIQHDRLAFSWARVILYWLLNTPKPAANINGDMLRECRDIYQGNQSMCKKIDDFETTYDPKNAVWWYTKDSFLYREVNAAFRTENILTIWKFRFVIQDIYKQLELLHAEQIKNSNSTSSKIHHLYRGQRMTSNELKQIKDNVGHLIAINSFLSTTLNYDLAEKWAGNGEDRPKFESVIFEIIIDEDKLENVPIIFANIASESNFEEEQEVLLAMGTILRIESVELEGNIWKICLHAYPFHDALRGNLETMFSKLGSLLGSDDNFAQLVIASSLFEMGNFEKAEQIYPQTSSCKNPVINIYLSVLKANIDIHQIVFAHPSIQSTKIIELLYKKKESLQQLKQFIRPDDYSLLNPLEIEVKNCDLIIEQSLSSDLNIFDPSKFLEAISQTLRQNLLFSLSNEMHLDDSPIRNPAELIDAMSQDNETFRLMNFEEMQSAIDQILVKNDPRRIGFLRLMAVKATKEKKDDQAIEFLRNALLIPCNDDERATLYNQLAKIYEKQNNWPAALECYENIISMIQLSETSTKLPLAHIGAAIIYGKNQDDHNAIVHYKRGVQLYCQYQSPHHPIVSSYKIVIGLKFKKLGDMDAALKTFQEVIELDHSDDVKVAYKHISRIYILKDDYDMAYYNLIESLKVAQREISPDIDFIIDIHLLLARVEFVRRHFAEGYVHMEEARVMSENNECTEATREEIQSVVKMFSDLQCFVRSHNRNGSKNS